MYGQAAQHRLQRTLRPRLAPLSLGVDADEVTRLAAGSRPHAVNLLAGMARKGVLHRIGRGPYAVIPPSVAHERKSYVTDPHLVIDELMRADGLGDRTCVAYQSAAAIHGVAQPLPFVLEIALPLQRRSVHMGQKRIRFIRIQPQTLFGFRPILYQEVPLSVPDREKTLLDCLERFDLCGGIGEGARSEGAPSRPAGLLRRGHGALSDGSSQWRPLWRCADPVRRWHR